MNQADSDSAVLRVRDLTTDFGSGASRVRAVNGISFDLGHAETLGLVGESGCGKSTTGRSILQLIRPSGGTVNLDGVELTTLRGEALRTARPNMQMVFQDSYASLNPRHTVEGIVSEPLRTHTDMSPADIRHRVTELIEMVGLRSTHRKRFPHEFSGGQRQRINIARALALRPKLIVCDEPVSALDVSIQAQIVNLFAELQRESGVAYLFIAHDLSMVRQVSHRIAVMYLGEIVELAAAEELFRNPMHPYTQALLSSIPVPDPVEERGRQRIHLVGEAPGLADRPRGCVFVSRCPIAVDRCATERPDTKQFPMSHGVACHLADGDGGSTVTLRSTRRETDQPQPNSRP